MKLTLRHRHSTVMTPYQCPCQDASTIILYYDILLYYRNTAQITIIVDSNPHNQFLTGGFNNLEEFGLRSLGWGAEFGISFSGNRAVIVYNINLVVLYTDAKFEPKNDPTESPELQYWSFLDSKDLFL